MNKPNCVGADASVRQNNINGYKTHVGADASVRPNNTNGYKPRVGARGTVPNHKEMPKQP